MLDIMRQQAKTLNTPATSSKMYPCYGLQILAFKRALLLIVLLKSISYCIKVSAFIALSDTFTVKYLEAGLPREFMGPRANVKCGALYMYVTDMASVQTSSGEVCWFVGFGGYSLQKIFTFLIARKF